MLACLVPHTHHVTLSAATAQLKPHASTNLSEAENRIILVTDQEVSTTQCCSDGSWPIYTCMASPMPL